MTTLAIVYHSGFGHTQLQAEAVRDGAAAVPGTEVLYLEVEEATARLDELDDVDAIVLGAPTYMGGPSAPMKAFLDGSASKWMAQAWKDKVAGGFTNSGSFSGDKVATLQALAVFAAQHAMVWVGQGEPPAQAETPDGARAEDVNRMGGFLGAMARSFNGPPGPDNPPSGDIETARRYGRRLAEAAARWSRGSEPR